MWMYQFGLRLAVTSYRLRHHGDASSASLIMLQRSATLCYAAALCIEAAGQDEARRAEN